MFYFTTVGDEDIIIQIDGSVYGDETAAAHRAASSCSSIRITSYSRVLYDTFTTTSRNIKPIVSLLLSSDQNVYY
jgi:hypothetical protein